MRFFSGECHIESYDLCVSLCFLSLCFFEIYVGPHQNPRRRQRNQQALDSVDCTTQNIEEDSGVPFLALDDVDQLLVGHYVAVNIEEWSNRPQLIGQVEKIGEPMVTIRWLDGSCNGTFRNSYVGKGANRQPWTHEIEKSRIVMIGVQFSSSRRIRREGIEELC